MRWRILLILDIHFFPNDKQVSHQKDWFYGIIFFSIRRYLNRIGKKRLKSNEIRFLSISEAFGAVKEVKVSGLEQIYLNTEQTGIYNKSLV